MSDKKLKYHTKTVKFGPSTLTLFSLDGQTWSSRKSELLAIKERQEAERVTLGDIKEEEGASEETQAEADDAPVEISAESAEEKEEAPVKKGLDLEIDDLDDDLLDDDIVDDAPAEPVKAVKPRLVEAPSKAAGKAPKKLEKPAKAPPAPKKKVKKAPPPKKGKPSPKGKKKAA